MNKKKIKKKPIDSNEPTGKGRIIFGEQCEVCVYWLKPKKKRQILRNGICRRYPTHMPTPPEYWCGEFEHNKNVELD